MAVFPPELEAPLQQVVFHITVSLWQHASGGCKTEIWNFKEKGRHSAFTMQTAGKNHVPQIIFNDQKSLLFLTAELLKHNSLNILTEFWSHSNKNGV